MEEQVIFGGFSSCGPWPRPKGAAPIASGLAAWTLGDGPVRGVASRDGRRRVLILGWCGASDVETRHLADRVLPDDIAWRWPGAYAVVEETEDAVAVHTDPASARPVYVSAYESGWAWCSSARFLASLTEADLNTGRIACSVLLPSVPTLAGTGTFFTGVEQLPPGSRTTLPSDGSSPRQTTLWRPDPDPARPPFLRLRDALTDAVALRAAADPDLSCDVSGGLDSTSVAVLAANALSQSHRLDAVTIHPEGDTFGADLRYAFLTADAYSGCVTHHLLPMTTEHLPYTRITSVPATDEPAPSTLTQARLTGQLQWMRSQLGARTHLTGDGGDSVLFQPPAHLADLIRHRRWRRAAGEAFGWARLRHQAVLPILRDSVRMSRTSRHRALADLARSIGDPGRDDHGKVRWFPLLPFPAWAEPAARTLLAEAAEKATAAPDALPRLDASVRVLVDEIREIARTAVADAQLAEASGIDLHNPFLDPPVVDAVLRTPLDQRPPVHTYKPLLVQAMSGLLPPAVAARTTKGSFDADHYAGLRANLPALMTLTDGHLADLGLINPARFRQALREAAAGIPMPLAAIEQALTVEAWLTAHHRSPAPAWTSAPVASTHG
ncbi:albusnodin/ikarugamycin family macrolactam cyclase [Streptomyces sp. B1866]|uniref:albusnodin/ikarugamycin family macrolactam cyclase n=1 Tax=Streptomyces sp. B1866 TaxID=3075431 RepID=UPI0028901409|nr:albusnodin/ikarugamycin family macrolactam cyclase [Streptomyces sp. B1866]MDT3395787.1 albusnodin/ikarugamycin family macrolactam cyclase [Streptomyces sp. B1866]